MARQPSILAGLFGMVTQGLLNPFESPQLRRLTLVEPWDLEESPVQKRHPQGYGELERARKRRRKTYSPLVASYRHPMIRD